jgi:hypothetical protein
MHEFILTLIQVGVCIQANDNAVLIDVSGLVDTITENRMAEAISERGGDAKFGEAMARLPEISFANFVVDAGIVHSLKTIVCFLTNSLHSIQHIVPALRKNRNFSADDYAALLLGPSHLLRGLRL